DGVHGVEDDHATGGAAATAGVEIALAAATTRCVDRSRDRDRLSCDQKDRAATAAPSAPTRVESIVGAGATGATAAQGGRGDGGRGEAAGSRRAVAPVVARGSQAAAPAAAALRAARWVLGAHAAGTHLTGRAARLAVTRGVEHAVDRDRSGGE